MSRAPAEHPQFNFTGGLNTDTSPVTFPDGASVDEENFELLLDGTRRRRRGFVTEADFADLTEEFAPDCEDATAVETFIWRAVGGNPTLNLHVWQVGNTLYFANDVDYPSTDAASFTYDLTLLTLDTQDQEDSPVDFAQGRGHLLVAGKYIEPAYLAYDTDSQTIVGTKINIRERDFQGVRDGYDDTTRPPGLSNEYEYNLLNAGWRGEDIAAFFVDQGNYPSKNMLNQLGFRRRTVDGIADNDGTLEFSSDKLIAELFQDAPAPKGHFIRNPFNTTEHIGSSGLNKNYVVSWLPTDPDDLNTSSSAFTTLTAIFASDHGLNPGDAFELKEDEPGTWNVHDGGDGPNNGWVDWSLRDNTKLTIGPEGTGTASHGLFTVASVVDSKTLAFQFSFLYPPIWENEDHGTVNGRAAPYYPAAYITTTETIEVDGTIVTVRPTAIAFFAGRIWYAGVDHQSLSASLFFSQVVESDAQYAKCYQIADPTSDKISDLIATDGGVLRIPETGKVFRIVPYASSLLVYAANGIWQVGPGADGYFTAISYSVRKLSDKGAVGRGTVVEAEGVPVYWGLASIYAIQQDPNSGFLLCTPISTGKIDTLFGRIPEIQKFGAVGTYDTYNKRILWAYWDTTLESSTFIVFDTRFSAFTKWRSALRIKALWHTRNPDDLAVTVVRAMGYVPA